jgi:putative membrane protein
MNALKQMSAALAVALAAPAIAQAPAPAPAPGAWPSAEQQRRAAQAPPAPSQPAPQQPAAPAPPLTDDQKAALGAVWHNHQIETAVGTLLMTRGKAAEIKSFGKGIADGHKTLAQLASLLQQRGVNADSLPAAPDSTALAQEWQQISTKSGDDLDRAAVVFMKQHGDSFEDAAKRAREATPGSDPTLKKLLDDAENVEEGIVAAARALDQRQVQARKPPAR